MFFVEVYEEFAVRISFEAMFCFLQALPMEAVVVYFAVADHSYRSIFIEQRLISTENIFHA